MRKKFLGIFMMISSFAIFLFNPKISGAVVGISYSKLNFVSLVFFIVGMILFAHKSGLEELTTKKFIDNPQELKRIANKMGYKEGREVKEGYQILYKGKPLTVIPRHNISPGVYRSIKEALITGEPNFRRRYPL